MAGGHDAVQREAAEPTPVEDERLAAAVGDRDDFAEDQRVIAGGLDPLLEEFLGSGKSHPNPSPLQPLSRRALFHGHCHLKALVGTAPSLRLLRSIPKLAVRHLGYHEYFGQHFIGLRYRHLG
jgi:hypothetical protein